MTETPPSPTEANREIITRAFDSISFNDLWSRVPPR